MWSSIRATKPVAAHLCNYHLCVGKQQQAGWEATNSTRFRTNVAIGQDFTSPTHIIKECYLFSRYQIMLRISSSPVKYFRQLTPQVVKWWRSPSWQICFAVALRCCCSAANWLIAWDIIHVLMHTLHSDISSLSRVMQAVIHLHQSLLSHKVVGSIGILWSTIHSVI